MNNVCRNFEFNEKSDGVLELISLKCDQCEFDGNCIIESDYKEAKKYAVSFEINVEE